MPTRRDVSRAAHRLGILLTWLGVIAVIGGIFRSAGTYSTPPEFWYGVILICFGYITARMLGWVTNGILPPDQPDPDPNQLAEDIRTLSERDFD